MISVLSLTWKTYTSRSASASAHTPATHTQSGTARLFKDSGTKPPSPERRRIIAEGDTGTPAADRATGAPGAQDPAAVPGRSGNQRDTVQSTDAVLPVFEDFSVKLVVVLVET